MEKYRPPREEHIKNLIFQYYPTLKDNTERNSNNSFKQYKLSILGLKLGWTISVLKRKEGYTKKYTPPPEGVPKGKALGNS